MGRRQRRILSDHSVKHETGRLDGSCYDRADGLLEDVQKMGMVNRMRAIDSDAFEKTLESAEIKARQDRKYVFESAINTIRGNLRNAPSVQPEPHWIPCSERLPEEDEWVIITYKFLGDDNDLDVSIDRIRDGKWLSSHVTAWMPLPSPYQKRGEQE